MSRIDTSALCAQYAASVFSLQDVLTFEANIPFAAATFVSYSGERYLLDAEPPIMADAA